MKKTLKAVARKGQTATDESIIFPIDPVIGDAIELAMKEKERLTKQLNELVGTARQIEAAISNSQSMTIGMLQSELLRKGITNYSDYEYSFEEKGFKKIK